MIGIMKVQDFYIKQYAHILGNSRYYSLKRFIIRSIANLHIKARFSHSYDCSKTKIAEDIVISLTSFPARIDNLWVVVECLMRQSLRPSKIILWLSKLQFSEDTIPKSLKRMENRGLEIRLVDEDIRSYKKFYYVFKEYPNSRIILVDDDLVYPSTFVEDLDNAFQTGVSNEEKVVVCRYAYHMKYSKEGNIAPYNLWKTEYGASSDKDLFFGTGGGTMLVPATLFSDVTDIELAMKLAPTADDIWINAMSRLSSCRIIKIADNGPLLPVINKSDEHLYVVNMYNNSNDIQIQNVIGYYKKLISINPFDF